MEIGRGRSTRGKPWKLPEQWKCPDPLLPQPSRNSPAAKLGVCHLLVYRKQQNMQVSIANVCSMTETIVFFRSISDLFPQRKTYVFAHSYPATTTVLQILSWQCPLATNLPHATMADARLSSANIEPLPFSAVWERQKSSGSNTHFQNSFCCPGYTHFFVMRCFFKFARGQVHEPSYLVLCNFNMYYL